MVDRGGGRAKRRLVRLEVGVRAGLLLAMRGWWVLLAGIPVGLILAWIVLRRVLVLGRPRLGRVLPVLLLHAVLLGGVLGLRAAELGLFL